MVLKTEGRTLRRTCRQASEEAGAVLERLFWGLDRMLARAAPWFLAAAAAYLAGHAVWALLRP
ncbi:MAG: hypothetical protein ACPLRW_05730 [Moorellales bacterium]